MKTGYYGTVGKNQRSKVHLHHDGKPVCGARISSKASFYWCAAGVHLQYVECKNCLEIGKGIVIAQAGALSSRHPLATNAKGMRR